MVAEDSDGKTVAMAITVPDINQVLKRMKGRLLPIGWWHYLNRRRIIDRCRVGFLGVKPAYQHTGVAAGLYARALRHGRATRVKGGEMGWILETNKADEPRHGGDGRRDRQAVPGVRAGPLSDVGILARCLSPTPSPEPEHEAEVRPLPVLAEPRPIERPREVSLPAAVAAATGGFLIGVATFVLVRVLRSARRAAGAAPGRAGAAGQGGRRGRARARSSSTSTS